MDPWETRLPVGGLESPRVNTIPMSTGVIEYHNVSVSPQPRPPEEQVHLVLTGTLSHGAPGLEGGVRLRLGTESGESSSG